MTDAELRALVRDAVARHLGRVTVPSPGSAPRAAVAAAPPHVPAVTHSWQAHASHHLYLTLSNADGSCVIEPAVPCDHCGYCKSHGH
jgi:hypothetical protein